MASSFAILPPGAVEKPDGSWVYPATRRPDGTWRKERPIRKVTSKSGQDALYIPQEEIGRFEIRAAKEERIRREKQAQMELEKQRQQQKLQELECVADGPDRPLGRHARKRLNRKARAEAEETKGEAKETEAITSTVEDQVGTMNKQIRGLKKKLRQIDELKQKEKEGADLNEAQVAKLSVEVMLISNLAEAEQALQALSLSSATIDE
mmetsp:Transcript_5296/g.7760  ORF Transcript_5296/g.7760 Transcript_5296/m.7760 type:complete len:208 (-) Transcript_5296:52-675(-)